MTSKTVVITDAQLKRLKSTSILWDKTVTGFCARRQVRKVVFYAHYREPPGGRDAAIGWHRVGEWGDVWDVEGARRVARLIILQYKNARGPK
jgi:hypothetical protein